jgi:hypothetical protein
MSKEQLLTDDAEGHLKPEPEIDDPRLDPLEKSNESIPGPEWERRIWNLKVRTPSFPSPQEQQKRVEQILEILDAERPEPESWQVEQAQWWLDNMGSLIPDHEQFVASSFQHYYPTWKELLKGVNRKSATTVLSWLKGGFEPKFAGTGHAKQSKKQIVESMLRRVVEPSEIPTYLSGRSPHQVEFHNHKSFYQNWGFSSDQVEKMVEWGAVEIREGPELPVVINPMGVIESAEKQRAIRNAMYPNLFLEALPFRYERLRDILSFIKKGSYMATWDFKSGYFHVPIHKDYWKYFCFKVGETIFYFKILCFGFAQACYVFTKIMQEPALELRRRGIPLSVYIDDGITAAHTSNMCLGQSTLCILLLGALGAFMGIPKCHLKPELVQKWLGFLADSEHELFRVAESKVNKIKQALEEMARAPTTSPPQSSRP